MCLTATIHRRVRPSSKIRLPELAAHWRAALRRARRRPGKVMWAATALKGPKLGGDEAVERVARRWAATARHGRKEPLALIAREGHAQLDWRWLLRLHT